MFRFFDTVYKEDLNIYNITMPENLTLNNIEMFEYNYTHHIRHKTLERLENF